MRVWITTGIALVALLTSACEQEQAEQVQRLKVVLQSPEFALEMAAYLDGAYYRGLGQTPPPFLSPDEATATVQKSVREEKIAINLAGFYAVESGLGVISERTRESPIDILDSISRGTRPKEDMLLLARFANATWKAGQPFRSLSRIARETFKPAALLSEDELKKDFVQIRAAARLLSDSMRDVRGQSSTEQLKRLQALLQSRDFAFEMATFLDMAYYFGQGQTPPPFLRPEEETATVRKSVREEKIAINLAGFYAVEAGLGVIYERTQARPLDLLQAVADGTRSRDDMLLLARFANATWKAGQPFRSLSRITRDTFRPAALLSQDELSKDFVQIQAAAQKLVETLRLK